MIDSRTLVAALAAAAIGGATFAQAIQSRYDVAGDGDWENGDNWNNTPDMGDYPNNDNEDGLTYEAIVRSGTLFFDEPTFLDRLHLGVDPGPPESYGSASVSGGMLDVLHEITVGGASTLAVNSLIARGPIDLPSSGLTINLATIEALDLVTIGDADSNSQLTLGFGATLNLRTGLTFARDGDLVSAGPIDNDVSVVNHGTTITKLNSSFGLSEIKTPFTDNGGSIFAAGGEIRFSPAPQGFDWPVTLNGTRVTGDGSGIVRFSRAATFNDATLVTNINGNVDFFSGAHVITGGLSLEGFVTLSGGSASLSGGEIRRGLPTRPARIDQTAGTIGATAAVTIGPEVEWAWHGGAIGPGGVVNRSRATEVRSGTGRIIEEGGQLLNAAGAAILVEAGIVVEGRIVNEGDISGPISGNAIISGTSSALFENRAVLTLGGEDGALAIRIPYTSSPDASIYALGDVIELGASSTVAGSVTAAAGNVELAGATTFVGTVTMEALHAPHRVALLIDDHVNEGTLTGGLFTGFVGLESGSLSGGVIDYSDDGFGFVHEGGDMGRSAEVENRGHYEFRGGRITGGGFRNTSGVIGSARDGDGPSHLVEQGTFTNEGHWTQSFDLALGEGGQLVNTGTWRMYGGASIALQAAATALITNSGVVNLLADQGEIVTVDVPYDSPGTTRAVGGRLAFDGGVAQVSETGALTGGMWEMFDGGVIAIAGAEITVLEDGRVALSGAGSAMEGLEMVERVDGELDLQSAAALDVDPAELEVVGRATVGTDGGGDGVVSRLTVNTLRAGGTVEVGAAGLIAATTAVHVEGGVLGGGGGTVESPVVDVAAGAVAPGALPPPADGGTDTTGALAIDGDYAQGAAGALEIEIGGVAEGTYDRLDVMGGATLGGTLRVSLVAGFEPSGGTTVTILTAAAVDGAFHVVLTPTGASVSYEADRVTVTFGAACPGDVDGNGAVEFADLLAVLSAWGVCAGCPEDLDGNGVVNFGDILIVLGAWGACG